MIMDIPEAQRIQKDFEAKFTEKANRATANISALKKWEDLFSFTSRKEDAVHSTCRRKAEMLTLSAVLVKKEEAHLWAEKENI